MTETKEIHDLIDSARVVGTSVYTTNGEKVGTIERVMLVKKTGQVAYAVLSFGGFLGLGNDYYPLPWASLSYDDSLGGYLTDVTQAQLEGAPKYSSEADWSWNAHARSVDDYYTVPIGDARVA